MILFDEARYQDIFRIFDENESGILDFREFLICFSVLLRGSFSQKLELFFSTFGSK
jgi:Ca2+-binding EF-hand superfamily protein